MNTYRVLFTISILAVLSSCKQTGTNCTIQEEDLMVMHKLIERSEPDTVKKYLSFYMKKFNLPVSVSDKPDGNYYGESPADDYGYKHTITFTLKHGEITAISYAEHKEDGHSKETDTSYCRQMNDHALGSAPSLTYPAYKKQFIQKKNVQTMDAISGATYSLYRFQYATIKALLNGPVK